MLRLKETIFTKHTQNKNPCFSIKNNYKPLISSNIYKKKQLQHEI